jgi:ribosomal subunit interface protein
MQVRVVGSNMDVGQALTQFVEENLTKSVKKYFDKAVNAEVHFVKNGHLFKAVITVNEGVKGGITVKSDAEAGDVYGCFNEAAEKAAKQLRRYKRKIKNYRRNGGGLKSVEPSTYKPIDAMKYILPPLEYNVFAEMENEESEVEELDESLKVINEKTTDIEELSVDEAIMKMDLANLPALVFFNKKNKRLNVVYHRKDGNISWIDPNV